jgi:hypothetical protein
MLFDLRGRGRRRTVKVIYIGLAVLIGVGLVGFGVGSGLGGGGILNSGNNGEGSGGTSFSSQIKKYEKLTQKQPANAANWEQLAKNLLHEAGGEAYVDQNTGKPTGKGKELYRRASQAWTRYLALNPQNPNPELAQLVYVIYSEPGLNEPAKAAQALNYVVEKRPTASYYAQLSEFAYKAKNPRLGDLAAAKAVSLVPASQRVALKNKLEETKKYPNGGQVFTTTTNGKVYKVRKAPNGSYTSIAPPTPAPTTSTGTTTTSTTKK